ncbi:MAG: hypothetical protein Q3998_04330 [Porphyromonas sp.]|nr:hypothetical protein [Porphyromonas sp.]
MPVASLLAILGTSCQNVNEALDFHSGNRKLTLLASVPQEKEGTRISLEKDPDRNLLTTHWQERDKVTFIFQQEDNLTEPIEVAVNGIGEDEKQAILNIEGPESINVHFTYTIYAFCSIPGSGVGVAGKEIVLDILPQQANHLQKITVPMMASATISEIIIASKSETKLQFTHLGAVEYVELKNGSDSELRVSNCHLYSTKEESEEWRYLPNNGKHYLYKPLTDEVEEIAGEQPNPIEENGDLVPIASGESHTFAVWHRPNSRNIPEFGISMQTEKEKIFSVNRKVAKDFPMVTGKAYRVRAEWKDNNLKISGE